MDVRAFRMVGGKAINAKTAHVEFRGDGSWDSRFSISNDGTERAGAAWTLRQAEQLVETGNWEEFVPPRVGIGPEVAPETMTEVVW